MLEDKEHWTTDKSVELKIPEDRGGIVKMTFFELSDWKFTEDGPVLKRKYGKFDRKPVAVLEKEDLC